MHYSLHAEEQPNKVGCTAMPFSELGPFNHNASMVEPRGWTLSWSRLVQCLHLRQRKKEAWSREVSQEPRDPWGHLAYPSQFT